MTLTPAQRSTLRRAMISQGTGAKTAGLSDDALAALAREHGIEIPGGEPEPVTPEPAPEPTPPTGGEPEPAPRRKRRKPVTETPPAKPATPPATPAPADGVAAAITAAVTQAIAGALDAQPATIDEAQIIALIDKHATKRHVIEITRDADAEPVTIEGAHEKAPTVIAALRAAKHAGAGWPLLVGPAGSGKTTLAEQVAKGFGLPFFSTGAVHQKYELTGFENAQGVYQATALYHCVTSGGVFLFDELDDSIAGAVVAFNQLLANGGMTFPGGEYVTAHKDCYFVAAANTSGTGATRQYIGRNPLDGATLDRFFEIEIQYDRAIETARAVQAFTSAGGTDIRIAERWIERVREVRTIAETEKWTIIVSPRASITGAALLAHGVDAATVEHGTLLRHMTADQRKRVGR